MLTCAMSEYALSKFVPLPDISPVLQKAATERNVFRLKALEICSVDHVEEFTPLTNFCEEATRLIGSGDAAFKDGIFREAVLAYTQVLQRFRNCCPSLSATCFAKRSATFAMMSCELYVRPANACALYGMDASRLACLALKDAEKVVQSFPCQSEGYLRCAFAHYLLEQYQKASDACLEGIRWNFSSRPLKECLSLVDGQLMDSVSQSHCQKQGCSDTRCVRSGGDVEDFECKLCLKLLYEPVTTPCGHSFCSCCIQRSLDHSNKCPMCRTVMHVSRKLPISVTLKNITSKLFSEEYKMRECEMSGELGGAADDQTCFLPLFVLFTLFPGEKMSLNVFEPCYRLMIRRVMEGNRRFGMIQSCCRSATGICSSGTECEIVECEPLADGRYFLEVIGRRRFDVLQLWEQDGYRIVKAKYFQDHPVQPNSQELASIQNHMKLVEKLEQTYKARGMFHRQSGLRWNLSDINKDQDMETMSFLACALLVNPDGSSARRKYLDCRSTLQRMEWILQSVHQP